MNQTTYHDSLNVEQKTVKCKKTLLPGLINLTAARWGEFPQTSHFTTSYSPGWSGASQCWALSVKVRVKTSSCFCHHQSHWPLSLTAGVFLLQLLIVSYLTTLTMPGIISLHTPMIWAGRGFMGFESSSYREHISITFEQITSRKYCINLSVICLKWTSSFWSKLETSILEQVWLEIS